MILRDKREAGTSEARPGTNPSSVLDQDELYKEGLRLVDRHLAEISAHILSSYPAAGIVAIINYGGYGREEGGIYCKEGAARPYNDYDILVVAAYPHGIDCNRVEKDIVSEYPIKFADVSVVTPSQLKKLRPTIFNFDLRQGSRVISGDGEILDTIPAFAPNSISLGDVETLFHTRMWCFLGSLPSSGTNGALTGEESRFFRNQMAKAFFAVVDSILIPRGKYTSSYRERADRVQASGLLTREESELCSWALEERFSPQAVEMSSQDVKGLFGAVSGSFFSRLLPLVGEHVGADCRSVADLSAAYRSGWRYGMSLIRNRIGLRHLHWRQVHLRLARAYMGEAMSNGMAGSNCEEVPERALQHARAVLGKGFSDSYQLRAELCEL